MPKLKYFTCYFACLFIVFLSVVLIFPPGFNFNFENIQMLYNASGEYVIQHENEDKININTAVLQELMCLEQIGEARATSIIAYRTKHGNFKSIDEIINVDGISENIFNNLKQNITIADR